jgi:hypothetical protein
VSLPQGNVPGLGVWSWPGKIVEEPRCVRHGPRAERVNDAHSTLCGKKARRGVVGVDDNGVGVQQEERFRRKIMSRLILKRWGWLACEAGQKGSGDVYQARNPRPKWGDKFLLSRVPRFLGNCTSSGQNTLTLRTLAQYHCFDFAEQRLLRRPRYQGVSQIGGSRGVCSSGDKLSKRRLLHHCRFELFVHERPLFPTYDP